MADTMEHKTDGISFHSQIDENLRHHELEDEILKNHESGEDYSSGSDRSIDTEITDEMRCDHETGRTSEGTVFPARIRSKKKRHGSHGSRRQKGGSRHKHRSFQPYPDTGELETTLKRKSLELQEKENAAALLRQEGGEDQFVTFPVAPFNSTQFLMDEHCTDSPNSNIVFKSEFTNSPKLCAQDVFVSSMPSTPRNEPAEDLEALTMLNTKDKEFSDIYSSIHAENLESMSKHELVKHYMSLEEKVALLQQKVAEAEQRGVSPDDVNDKEGVPSSDTNSLSSGNEEFVDLSMVNSRKDNVPQTV